LRGNNPYLPYCKNDKIHELSFRLNTYFVPDYYQNTGMIKREKLFEQFPPVSKKEWLDKISADLKGADFKSKSVWKTGEGFEVMPFYMQEDNENFKYIESLPGEYPYLRGNKTGNNAWKIRQDITVKDYLEANRKTVEILMKGVDSLGFIIDDPESLNEKNSDSLLKYIYPEFVELNFISNGRTKEIVEYLLNYINKTKTDPQKITGAIETDPLGRLMLNGTLCIPVEKGLDYLADVAAIMSPLRGFKAVNINASNFCNAGSDLVQELGFAISMGTEYVSQLVDRGIGADVAASRIRFSFGTGSNFFPEIAKLRAARLLWSAVMNGFIPGNYESARMEIHCITSRWNKTLYDPHVNILRTQTEAMAAILGGTDSLTIEPFDRIFREPNEFSERIARNQQLILKEESYFGKVADPVSGSYYIENLTSLLADNAWKLFLEAESYGGFLESLKNGFIQRKIKESAAKRKNDISKRKIKFIGTSLYPEQDEKIPPRTDIDRLFMEQHSTEDIVVEPVRLCRGPAVLEKMRVNVEKAARKPVAFMFTTGDLLMRKARAQFASDFFGCAGYRIIDNPGFETVEEGIKTAMTSESDIVVICSSDEEYSSVAPEIFKQLKNTAVVVIAGNPPCMDELKSLGIEHFISSRSDIVETLEYFNTHLGVKS